MNPLSLAVFAHRHIQGALDFNGSEDKSKSIRILSDSPRSPDQKRLRLAPNRGASNVAKSTGITARGNRSPMQRLSGRGRNYR